MRGKGVGREWSEKGWARGKEKAESGGWGLRT